MFLHHGFQSIVCIGTAEEDGRTTVGTLFLRELKQCNAGQVTFQVSVFEVIVENDEVENFRFDLLP